MSSNPHGEWTLRKLDGEPVILILGPTKEDGGQTVLARIDMRNSPDAEANAHLMLRAPQMHAQLLDIRKRIETDLSDWSARFLAETVWIPLLEPHAGGTTNADSVLRKIMETVWQRAVDCDTACSMVDSDAEMIRTLRCFHQFCLSYCQSGLSRLNQI